MEGGFRQSRFQRYDTILDTAKFLEAVDNWRKKDTRTSKINKNKMKYPYGCTINNVYTHNDLKTLLILNFIYLTYKKFINNNKAEGNVIHFGKRNAKYKEFSLGSERREES